nr:Ycf58 [Porphyropsis coccinea]
MDINTFFTMNEGNWISQKTSYHPNLKKHITKKGKILITETTNNTNMREKIKLNNINLNNNTIKSYTVNKEQDKKTNSTIIIANENKYENYKQQGKIYLFNKKLNNKLLEGIFQIEKEVFTIIIKDGQFEAEEKIWFVNPNLKLTNSIVRHKKNCINISFTSEIKIQIKKFEDNNKN